MAAAGLEGEALLCEALRARRIAFWPEQQLRAEGFFKTPDVKLQARCLPAFPLGHQNVGEQCMSTVCQEKSFLCGSETN